MMSERRHHTADDAAKALAGYAHGSYLPVRMAALTPFAPPVARPFSPTNRYRDRTSNRYRDRTSNRYRDRTSNRPATAPATAPRPPKPSARSLRSRGVRFAHTVPPRPSSAKGPPPRRNRAATAPRERAEVVT